MPVQSTRETIQIPDVGIYEFTFGQLDPADEDKVAIIDIADGTETTYQQLRSYINCVAGGLSHLGIRSGDVVALHCPNSLAFVVYAHAVWRLGATLTPVSLLADEAAITRQLQDSGARMLITLAAMGDHAAQAAQAAGLSEEQVHHLDRNSGMQQMLAERRHAPEDISFDPATHLAVLPYSSGTTQDPKGVRLSHRNLVANVCQAADQDLVTREDVVFGVLPFFHIYGLTALLNLALKQRATLVTQPRFELGSFLASHERFGVTFTFIAPPIAVLLAKHPQVEEFDLSSLRAVLSGAAALDTSLAEAVQERLGVDVYQGFGMTESSPVTHLNLDMSVPRGSIGLPVANTEHKLVAVESGEEIPRPNNGHSEVGELWVRGPQVMLGYLNRDRETAETLVDGGWLRTGDLAVQDPEGNVYVVDRLKEVIKYKGYQVAPAELEALLLTHPEVADAAVIGVAGEDGLEIPKAFVVLQQNATATAEDIMAYVAEQVPSYKKVRAIEFIDAIPKSSTGKILRRVLRARED